MNGADDDESYARQLQAQFLAEAEAEDGIAEDIEVDQNRVTRNENYEASAQRIRDIMGGHASTNNRRESAISALTDNEVSNLMSRYSSRMGIDDWTDDHMTDEELAMMLESMQVEIAQNEQEKEIEIAQNGENVGNSSEKKVSQINKRGSDGSGSALAAQLYAEEIRRARQMDEDERLARELEERNTSFRNHEVPTTTAKINETLPSLIESRNSNDLSSTSPLPRKEYRKKVEVSDSIRAIDNIGKSLASPSNNDASRKTIDETPEDTEIHIQGRDNPKKMAVSDSVRAIDNIGQALVQPISDDASTTSSKKKGPFRMPFFGLGNKQQASGNNGIGAKLINPILNIPSVFASSGIGSRENIGMEKKMPDSEPNSSNTTISQNNINSISNTILPKCDGCGRVTMTFISALGKKFHASCFRCAGCHEVIDPTEPFAFIGEQEKQPLHRGCYAELYGIKCSVCTTPLSPDEQGRISYVKHPFFDKECMCPSHAVNAEARRCTGCHRFEPKMNRFAELGDNDRCVCWSCCRTVVVDSDDALPLWNRVLSYMEVNLGLPLWTGMNDIPVLVVDHDTLNERSQRSAHHGSKQIMTRGLCLSEHHIGRRFRIPKLRYDSRGSKFTAADAEGQGLTFFRIPDASKTNPNTNVTAILCLSGMPRDLAASILAHEATHAWIKMHPDYDATKPLPPVVEEGCCQLIAHLFLTDGLDPASKEMGADGGPSDEKLRQYFKFSIETDEDAVYGEGFRIAGALYAEIGILPLLSHIVLYRNFPIL